MADVGVKGVNSAYLKWLRETRHEYEERLRFLNEDHKRHIRRMAGLCIGGMAVCIAIGGGMAAYAVTLMH